MIDSLININTLLKIGGGASICLSCTLIGLYLSYRTDYRINDLEEIRKALFILKSEIEYALNTLPEAFLHVGERTERNVRDFFRSMSIRMKEKRGTELCLIWENEIKKHFAKGTFLTYDDFVILEQLGKTVGHLDKSLQVNNIHSAIDYIDEKISYLRIASEKNKRLYSSLGILGGLLIITIIL